MDNNTFNTPDNLPDFDDMDGTTDLELFSEELEDRFNADAASSMGSASCATSCWTTLSTFCTFL